MRRPMPLALPPLPIYHCVSRAQESSPRGRMLPQRMPLETDCSLPCSAAEGMSGPGNAFDGRNGLWEKVTGPFQLAPFPNQGGAYLTPRVQLKYWPIETNGQAAVWAALELRSKVNPSGLKAIDVFTSKFTWFEIGSEREKWDPKTRETADHSLPYIFARALVDGPIRVTSSATKR